MKLWEVLKALEENPKKVFETKYKDWKAYTDDWNYLVLERYDDGKLINCHYGAGGFNGNFEAENTNFWQEVKQSVTWQEALEAWSVGKKIRCEILNRTYVYDRNIHTALQSIDGGYLIADELVNGTWYIEN